MQVKERFLKYVAFDTTSDETSETVPSSAKQLVLGKYLAEELKNIGLCDARIDDKGYVYGYLPASEGVDADPVGFISHMDTSSSVSGADIKPQSIIKDGEELIVTDGTTLLGGDDKAGISEIFTAVEYLINHPEIKHRRISVGITPDEEIGRGADYFDVKNFGAKYAYTVDGGLLGELEYECFNAANGRIIFNGINIHPGSAKNKMKNALLVANEFINMLPPAETPSHTEGYEGFYHAQGIQGDETLVRLDMLIRDHDMEKFQERKAYVESVVSYLNNKYGEGTVVATIKDSYYNMKEKLKDEMYVVERAEKAMLDAGVTPKIIPIRGGTDGARLSYEGLPCPNLSTGGDNFHSVDEYISVPAMEKMVEVLVNLAKA